MTPVVATSIIRSWVELMRMANGASSPSSMQSSHHPISHIHALFQHLRRVLQVGSPATRSWMEHLQPLGNRLSHSGIAIFLRIQCDEHLRAHGQLCHPPDTPSR